MATSTDLLSSGTKRDHPVTGRELGWASYDAARAASCAAEVMAETGRLNDGWRFGVLQTIDFYNSAVKRDGVEGGARVFAHEPPPTGSIEVDAAFAALAAHLADRDGWKPPAWALSTARTTPQPWYVTQLRSQYFVDQANRETPPEFRRRGVFIGANDLARA